MTNSGLALNLAHIYSQKALALNPVSQLAGLTDHIPYALTLRVTGIDALKPTPFRP